MTNFSDTLKENITEIIQNANEIVENYDTWKTEGQFDLPLESSYKFCKKVLELYSNYENDIGVKLPTLIGTT